MHYPFPSAASIQNFVVTTKLKYYKISLRRISRASVLQVYLDMVWGKLELLGITWQALQGGAGRELVSSARLAADGCHPRDPARRIPRYLVV